MRTMTHLLMCPQHQTGGLLPIKCFEAFSIWLSERDRGTTNPCGKLKREILLQAAVNNSSDDYLALS